MNNARIFFKFIIILSNKETCWIVFLHRLQRRSADPPMGNTDIFKGYNF
jgi:hypothetical protein